MQSSGYALSCDLGNVVYHEPDDFDSSIKSLDILEKILSQKRDMINIYIAQVRARRILLVSSREHFSKPSHMDKINNAIVEANVYFLISNKSNHRDDFQPNHDDAIKILYKEIYTKYSMCSKAYIVGNDKSVERILAFSDGKIMIGSEEISVALETLTVEKKELVLKEMYELLNQVETNHNLS